MSFRILIHFRPKFDAAAAADDNNEQNWRKVRPIPGKLFIVAILNDSSTVFGVQTWLYRAVKERVIASGNAGWLI